MSKGKDKTIEVAKSAKNLFKRWGEYAQFTNLAPIMRRYFVMNAFDGVLTTLGLVIGTFILFLSSPESVTREGLVITGVATTFAIAVSGIIGAFLSEIAEQRKASIDISREMAEMQYVDIAESVELDEKDYYPYVELKDEDANVINGEAIEHVDVDPVPVKLEENNEEILLENEGVPEEKGFAEKAESFTTFILSITDGFSPALGALMGLIPFFFADPSMVTYILSFLIEIGFLFGLGAYLARISEDSMLKYGIEMVLAGLITAAISFLIGAN